MQGQLAHFGGTKYFYSTVSERIPFCHLGLSAGEVHFSMNTIFTKSPMTSTSFPSFPWVNSLYRWLGCLWWGWDPDEDSRLIFLFFIRFCGRYWGPELLLRMWYNSFSLSSYLNSSKVNILNKLIKYSVAYLCCLNSSTQYCWMEKIMH